MSKQNIVLINHIDSPIYIYYEKLDILYIFSTDPKADELFPKNIRTFIRNEKKYNKSKEIISYIKKKSKKLYGGALNISENELLERKTIKTIKDTSENMFTIPKETKTESIGSVIVINDIGNIPVISEDTYEYLMHWIAYKINIAEKFQLLLDTNNKALCFRYSNPFIFNGYDKINDTTFENLTLMNDFILRENCIVLYSLGDYINTNYEHFKQMSETELYNTYNILHVAFPSISLDDLIKFTMIKESPKGTMPTKNKNIAILRNLDTKDINKILRYDTPTVSEVRTTIRYSKAINIIKIFNKFELDDTWKYVIAKFDETNVFIKYRRNFENDRPANPIIPSSPSLVFNDHQAIILPDGKITYIKHGFDEKIKKYITDDENDNIVVTKFVTRKYRTKIMSNVSVNLQRVSSLISSYYPLIEPDYNYFISKYRFVFVYKAIDIIEKSKYGNIMFLQIGSYVRIMLGGSLFEVTFNNITNNSDANSIFNFIVRFIYMAILFGKKHDSKSLVNISKSQMLKDADPILFGTDTSSSFSFADYARIAQKNKQPLVFNHGSNVLKQFLKEHKWISQKNIMTMQNITYSDRKNTYVCDNKNYPYPSFLTKLSSNGKCLPVCGSVDKSNTQFYKTCISGDFVPYDESSLSNLYYIRKYNNEHNLPEDRLSFLPGLLNNYLINREECKIVSQTLIPGSSCYLLVGMGKYINKIIDKNVQKYGKIKGPEPSNEAAFIRDMYDSHNIFVLFIQERNESIVLQRNTDTYSILNAIKNNLCLFILKTYMKHEIYYSVIGKVINITKKVYRTECLHKENDLTTKMMKIVKMTDNRNIRKGHVTLMDLITSNIRFKQVLTYGTRTIYNIYINNVLFPIIPSLPNNSIGTIPIESIERKNNINDVLEVLKIPLFAKRLRIIAYLQMATGSIFGFRFNSDYIITFDPSTNIVKNRKIGIEFYDTNITYTNASILNTKIDIEIELYNMFIMHISYYINESFVIDSKTHWKQEQWNKELQDSFGDLHDIINNELNLIRTKKWSLMEYFKKYKMLLRSAKVTKEVTAILYDLMDKHISFDQLDNFKLSGENSRTMFDNDSGTIEKLYNGKRMRIPKYLYDQYIPFIADEYLYNEMKRYQIMENKFPELVNLFDFKDTPKVIIKKLR